MTIQQRTVPSAQVAYSCPYCEGRDLRWYRSQRGDKCQVVCEGCGAAGPFDPSPAEALRAWLDVAAIAARERSASSLNTELDALALPALERVIQQVTERVLLRVEHMKK